MPSRRALLSATAVSSIGGCLGRSTGSGRSTLKWISISNAHDEPHTAELKIDWDGKTVLDETYKLPPSDNPDVTTAKTVDWVWPDEPGQFTVSAREPGGEWWTENPADQGYPECFALHILFDGSSGTFGVFRFTTEPMCSDETVERLKENSDAEIPSNTSTDRNSS